MINITDYYTFLQNLGVSFITGVPDSLLNDFCCFVEKNMDSKKHIIAANEGNAVAIASGYHLATGGVPLVYMQNSGIGNAMNPLISLTHPEVYSIPMLLLIGWRGDPAVKDHVQHKVQGDLTLTTLDNLDIPYFILEDDLDNAFSKTKMAYSMAKASQCPVALIVKKGVLERGTKDTSLKPTDDFPLSREAAIGVILDIMPSNTIYVASTGRITRELNAQRIKRGESHCQDFLMVGSMGHASQIALGLALAKPDQHIVCLDGDASLIMHMGGMSIVGGAQAKNFYHIVLNNGAHESVGGQKSSGFSTDLTAVAAACGYATSDKYLTNKAEILNQISVLKNNDNAKFLEIRVHKGIRSNIATLTIDHLKRKNMLISSMKVENDEP